MRRSLVVDDVAAKGCIHPCGREAIEENLVDVHGSGIFVIERRDELSWLTCCMTVSRQSNRRCAVNADLPLLAIMCILPAGKMVAWPGVRDVTIVWAPFSSCIQVVVLPSTATTQLAARGW